MSDTSGSVIVYGPQGCGKTRNASRIASHFGLNRIVDGCWDERSPMPKAALILTNDTSVSGARDYFLVMAEIEAKEPEDRP